MDQERKFLRSKAELEEHTDFFPLPIKEKQYELFATVATTEVKWHKKQRKTYSDQIGWYPCKSSRRNQYLFVLYNYDGNAIIADPLKSQQGKSIITGFIKCHERLTKHGHKVKKIGQWMFK